MRILYAGEPGTAHSEAYVRFLGELGETRFLDVAELASADLSDADLLVVDADWQLAVPAGLTVETLSMPTVLVGNFGVKVGEALHLKIGTNYGCMCLDEDAIVWDPTHPVFEGLTGALDPKPGPANFRSYSSILDVPETFPALRVLRDPIGKSGQVTAGFGFNDSPDCEVIAGGFNEKTQEHFAIGRQSRFLHWGFAGSPDDYTPEGRVLLAACLRYLVRFADDPVRELRTTDPRPILQMLLALEGWRGTGLPPELAAMIRQQYLEKLFAGEIPEAARGERPERLAWFDTHAPFLRNDGAGYYVDTDAQALGLATNDVAFLDACLKQGEATLWERYTGRPLDDRSAGWLAENREHLYFTDWGGYRWVSALDVPSPQPPAADRAVPQATPTLGAARYGDVVRCMLMLELPAGFYAYAPGSQDGLPLALTVRDGVEVVEELAVVQPAGEDHLSGNVLATFAVRGVSDEMSASLRVQLCDELTCLAPQTLELRCPVVEGTP